MAKDKPKVHIGSGNAADFMEFLTNLVGADGQVHAAKGPVKDPLQSLMDAIMASEPPKGGPITAEEQEISASMIDAAQSVGTVEELDDVATAACHGFKKSATKTEHVHRHALVEAIDAIGTVRFGSAWHTHILQKHTGLHDYH